MLRKVYKTKKAGDLKNLKLVEEELAGPGRDEVLIEIKTFGLNFADTAAIMGLYNAAPKENFIPGLEYAGVVTEVGGSVTRFKPGDKVMGVTRFGGYVNYISMDHRYVIPLPEGWNFDEGAAYLVQVLTAYYALAILGDIKEGQTVLIHSAAGGVGIWANRIAKNYHAYTIGTVGSDKKLEFLKQEGYDKAIVRSDNFREDLRNALGDRELNIVMECIGGKILMDAYVTMAAMGRMIVYGSARYMSPTDKPNWLKMALLYLKRPKIDPQKMPEQNKAIMGFNLIYLFERNDLLHKYLDELSKLDIGKPHVGHTFEFDQVQDAVRKLLSGKTKGKVVIRTDNF